jgi:GNAT superfamily N-acetyltransferase
VIWSLTRALPSDWDRAWAIQHDAFLDDVTRAYGGWTPAEIEKCERAWAPRSTQMLHIDGDLAGWIRLEHRADCDWLDLLVIATEHQRRGVGTSVLRSLMSDAERRGVPLWLSVHRDNDARRLYARLGFREVERDERRVFMVHPASTSSPPPAVPIAQR